VIWKKISANTSSAGFLKKADFNWYGKENLQLAGRERRG